MDWAETIVENLYTEGIDGDGYPCRQRMEKALRKAKADGMREAVQIARMNQGPKYGKMLNWLELRASAIEKGME